MESLLERVTANLWIPPSSGNLEERDDADAGNSSPCIVDACSPVAKLEPLTVSGENMTRSCTGEEDHVDINKFL